MLTEGFSLTFWILCSEMPITSISYELTWIKSILSHQYANSMMQH